MYRGGKQSYSLASFHKNISCMDYSVRQSSSRSHHGSFTRSGHRGLTKTTGQNESRHTKSTTNCKPDLKIFSSVGSKALLHKGHQKTSYKPKGLSVFKPSAVSHGYNASSQKNCLKHFGKRNSPFGVNQKKIMRNLNERLSSYMEKVLSLQQENEWIKKNIEKWLENNAPSKPADHSQYYKMIQELQNQISTVLLSNMDAIRDIDNTRIAMDHYNNKYEMELILRSTIDADVIGLRGILEGFNGQTVILESEVDKLQEEMLKMRRDSEQEINSLTTQLGTRVSVEVEASPSGDLKKSLFSIREEYEKLMERNLGELETLFLQKTKKLNKEVTTGTQRLQLAQIELIDVKHSLQTMRIELQSEQHMISTLQETLAEKNTYYVSELAQLQGAIINVESQLDQFRTRLESQNEEYQHLMDKKTHLEQEIRTYQYLLDGHGTDEPEHSSSTQHIEQSSNGEQKERIEENLED